MPPARTLLVRFCYLLGIVAAVTHLACTSDLATKLSGQVENPERSPLDPGAGNANQDAGDEPNSNNIPDPCVAGNSDDTDLDGTPDCLDGCPEDRAKVAPGTQGCGASENPLDSGTPNKDPLDSGTPNENPLDNAPDAMVPCTGSCLDECPNDPAKTQPGRCGCGVPDSTTDRDSDGLIDCLDSCPDDTNKLEPGTCGCGVSDESDGRGVAQCLNLVSGLLHRYSFSEPGLVVNDSVGTSNAVIVNQRMTGSGQLSLEGGESDQYVALPDTLLLGLTDVSFEIWFTWHGGISWQRLFDFGQSSLGEEQGEGVSYLALVPFTASTFSLGGAMLLYKAVGEEEVRVPGTTTIVPDEPTQLTVVFDDTANTMSLYLNGALEGSLTTLGSLADVGAVNHWLGRSQFVADAELSAELDEFRIHARALTPEQVRLSALAGPNPPFLSGQ